MAWLLQQWWEPFGFFISFFMVIFYDNLLKKRNEYWYWYDIILILNIKSIIDIKGVIGLLGIARLFDSFDAFKASITFFMSMFYLLIFGLLVIFAELKINSVIKYFGFLFSFRGTGLFYIFCGMLIVGIEIQDVDFPIGLAAGIFLIQTINQRLICNLFYFKASYLNDL